MGIDFTVHKGVTSKAVSYLAVVINILIMAVAGCMLGLGVWLVAEDVIGVVKTVLPNDTIWEWLAYGMIVTGTVLTVMCGTGIFAFMKQKRSILTLYCILIVFGFCGCALFVGLPLWYKEKVKQDLYSNMEESIYHYNGETATDDHSVFWNYIQTRHRCCGYDNEQDYRFVPWSYNRVSNTMYIPTLGNVTRRFPASCCQYFSDAPPSLSSVKKGFSVNPVYVTDCYLENPYANEPFSHDEGCYRKVRSMLTTNMTLMGTIASILVGLLILLFLLSLFVIAANAPTQD